MMPILVFPAPAGINRAGLVFDTDPASVPRASGDKPGIKMNLSQLYKCSPAPAGINRVRLRLGTEEKSVPRASGDKPIIPEIVINYA
ncbi:hypothetical protein SEEN4900_14886, partial [Salmonella enterica subsp. enterica serovar Newport str. WA_14900]